MAIDDQTIRNLITAIENLINSLNSGSSAPGGGPTTGGPGGGDTVEDIEKRERALAQLTKELEQQLTLKGELAKAEEDQQEKIKDLKEAIKNASSARKRQLELELADEEKKLETIEAQNDAYNEGRTLLQKVKGEVVKLQNDLGGTTKSLFSITGLMSDFLDGAKEVDKVIAKLNKQGLAGVTTSLNDAQASVARFGLGLEAAGELLVGLGGGTSTFRFESAESRKELLRTAAAFKQLGVDGSAFGELQATLARNLNMTSKEVTALADDFSTLSAQTGKSIASLVSDFNSAGDSILQFGSRATDVFIETQKTATRFGVSVNTVLGIFEKFDTIEGAVEAVGQLNAQFGMNLDQLQLLRAETPQERFDILKESIEATGKSFSDLSRLERKAMSQILGTDIGELQRVFGAGIELNAGQQGLQKLAETTKTIGERISAIYQQITTGLAEAGVFDKISKTMTDAFAEGGPVDNFVKQMLPSIISFGQAFASGIGFAITAFKVLAPVIKFVGGIIHSLVIMPIKGLFNVVGGIADMFSGNIVEGLKRTAKGALQVFFSLGPIGRIARGLFTIFRGIGRFAGTLSSKIGDIFRRLGEGIRRVPFIGRLFGGPGEMVKATVAVNALEATGTLDKVLPTEEKAFAKGGIIKPGTSGIVGDPLTPGVPRIERVTATSQGAMVQPMPNSGGGGAAQKANVVINIDGKKMGQTVVDLIDSEHHSVLGG